MILLTVLLWLLFGIIGTYFVCKLNFTNDTFLDGLDIYLIAMYLLFGPITWLVIALMYIVNYKYWNDFKIKNPFYKGTK